MNESEIEVTLRNLVTELLWLSPAEQIKDNSMIRQHTNIIMSSYQELRVSQFHHFRKKFTKCSLKETRKRGKRTGMHISD